MLERYYYAQGGTKAASVATPAATYESGVLGLSPTAYWPMSDSAGNFADATGNGWTATAAGDPTYQQTGPTIATAVQDAIAFDGTGDFATVSANIDDSVTDEMTISFWFYCAPSAASEALVSMYDTGVRSWRAFLSTTGECAFYTYQTDGASLWAFNQPSGTYDDSAWHHMVAWVTASGSYFDVDGGTLTSTNESPTGTWNGPTTSGLALAAANTSGSSAATISLAHVAYWDSDIGATARGKLYSGSF